MWVKICGITNRDDALAATEAGADAIGFVLVPTSSRAMTRHAIEEILKVIPPMVLTVGVTANENTDYLHGLLRVCSLGAVQFHGEEPPETVLALKESAKLIKAIRVKDSHSLESIPLYRGVDAILLDAYDPQRMGGTGQPFDWNLAVRAKQHGIPLIIAGGLNARNLQEVIQRVQPHGVDVSSGVEVSPGKKSFSLIREFVLKAKKAV